MGSWMKGQGQAGVLKAAEAMKNLKEFALILPAHIDTKPSSPTRRRPSNAARRTSNLSPTSNTARRAKHYVIFLYFIYLQHTTERRRAKAEKAVGNTYTHTLYKVQR